jgi:superfamily I DNA/RNA helicase
MKERIIKLAKDGGIIEKDESSPPQLWVGTFHSFCGRILRENAFEAGLDPDFTVLSEADARLIHHRIIDDFVSLRLNTETFRPEEYQNVRFENPRFLYNDLFVFISKLKDQLINPDEFHNIALRGRDVYYSKLDNLFNELPNSPDLASRTIDALKRRRGNIPYERKYESEMIEIVYHIYKAYQERLNRKDALDFGDLIFNAYVLLKENKRIRQRYQKKFRYILVDEFQDTNEAQFEILRLLAHDEEKLPNTTVVGDDKQAIYAWRNARVENVDDFEAETWGGQSLNISMNYRSYGEILEVAHYAIVQDEKFNQKAEDIKLHPEMLGMANESRVVLYEAKSRNDEADFVTHELTDILNKGSEPNKIAILMRSLRSVKVYEDALREAQIPYITTGGTGFYDRQEIRDILAYLRVLDDPFDTIALIRVLKRPPIGLNDLSLYQLRRDKNEQLYDSLSRADELLDDNGAVKRVRGFMELLEGIWKTMGDGGIFYLLSQVIERSGYLKYIYSMSSDRRGRSLANIKKLLRMASQFEGKDVFSDLRDFVKYIQFSMEQMVVEGEAGIGSDRKAVQIMTIHQAKGLEFNVVFVINARKPSFPTNPRHPKFAMHKEDGLIINEDRDGDKFFKFQPYDLKKNSHFYDKYGIINHYEQFKQNHLQEERRIWYVAMTRAKHILYLSCPRPFVKSKSGKNEGDFFQEIRQGFSDRSDICQFRDLMKKTDRVAELPLWKDGEKSVFNNIDEAEEYGKRLMELITSRKSNERE